MEKRSENIYLKILVNILIYIAIFFLLIFLGPKIFRFFLPFIIAWVISWIANPLVRFLDKKFNLVRQYSSILIIFLVIALVVFGLYMLISFVANRIVILVSELPNIAETINMTLNQVSINLNQILSGFPLVIQEPILELGESVRLSIINLLSDASIPEATIDFTRNIFDYIIFTIIVFIASYFFIKDNHRMIRKIKQISPDSVQEKYQVIQYHFVYAVGGCVKAQLKLMGIVIVILYIGFKLIDVPYAFLIALITGFIILLPILGTGFIIWPWAAIELILGNYFNGTFLIALYVICQFTKNVLQPKVVGDTVGIDAFTTFVLMFIGFRLSGVLGLILSVPIGLILYNLYEVGMFNNMIRGFKILFTDINEYRKF